jgi:CHASE2 domain-containing sensor protein
MVMECSAMVVIIGVVAYSTMRSGRYFFAVGIMPLALVPIVHLMGRSISRALSAVTPLSRPMAWIAADIAALVVACILFGILSLNFEGKKQRLYYLIVCGGFSLVLTCVMIADLII